VPLESKNELALAHFLNGSMMRLEDRLLRHERFSTALAVEGQDAFEDFGHGLEADRTDSAFA
jgi:hypothetical protein